MRRLRKFFNLPNEDQRLICRAAGAVLAARVGLSLLPFRLVRAVRVPLGKPRHDACGLEDRMAWAVRAVSGAVPFATCLVQALALEWMLRRVGATSELKIGVAKDSPEVLAAHAWLERDGRVLIGASPGRDYATLARFSGD